MCALQATAVCSSPRGIIIVTIQCVCDCLFVHTYPAVGVVVRAYSTIKYSINRSEVATTYCITALTARCGNALV